MRPLILITNDDGIFSPGLHAAAEAVMHLGDILVAAPRFQQTAMGRAFPRGEQVGIIEPVSVALGGEQVTMYGVYGSPAHAVAYAVKEIAGRKPDLCISGVNYGENLGLCISCSGTLGAALEADSHGIPAIAVSKQVPVEQQHTQDYPTVSWLTEKRVTAHFAGHVLTHGMPCGVSVWNINVPPGAGSHTEIRMTRQSRENCHVFQRPAPRDWAQAHPLETRLELSSGLMADEDAYAVYIDQVISATPLTWNMSVNPSEIRGVSPGSEWPGANLV